MIKTIENDEFIYALKYLCAYKNDQQNEILNDLNENQEENKTIFPEEEKQFAIMSLKRIKRKLPKSTLTKIDSHHFELKQEGDVFNFSVENGVWKINPYSYKIIE